MTIDISVPSMIQLKQGVVSRRNLDEASFINVVLEQIVKTPSIVLMSGGPKNSGRYSIIASEPLAVFKAKGRSIEIETSRGKQSFDGDPLKVLDSLFSRIHVDYTGIVEPFCGGAVGYFAYELKNRIERLPQSALDDVQLPDLFLFFPSHILVHDREKEELHSLVLSAEKDGFYPLASEKVGTLHTEDVETSTQSIVTSNFTMEDYCSSVENIREYILNGDVYQVNLAQRLTFQSAVPAGDLWLRMFEKNPSPYYAYINAGDHVVMSTSMECFLKRRGKRILSRPIKGTRRRGRTEYEDALLKRELQSSGKDDAELSMIVDLMRNDLGRICSPGSVGVSAHKTLESYTNVHHLVSTVEGELAGDLKIGDILRATFPAGSIAGCPKIRAMEIINELEPHVRHVYTGAIGYLGFHDNLELNVAIRTIVGTNGTYHFGTGGGVVFDSDPEMEYEETLHKAETLLRLISGGDDVNEQ